MNEKQTCLGHENGFEHFEVDIAGLEMQFDFGIKCEEIEPDDYSIDPITGVKVWAEPVLVAYISVRGLGGPREPSLTLRYGLTRSKFSGGIHANEADEQTLLNLASALLPSHLKLLSSGKGFEILKNINMLLNSTPTGTVTVGWQIYA